jgi:hypothetical protein
METPLVKEDLRPLEPVGPDPFIDSSSPAPAHGWAAAAPIPFHRLIYPAAYVAAVQAVRSYTDSPYQETESRPCRYGSYAARSCPTRRTGSRTRISVPSPGRA